MVNESDINSVLKETTYQFLRRLRKNYFDNQFEERKHNYLDWRYILEVIEKKDNLIEILKCSLEIKEFKKIPNAKNNIENWYNNEIKFKMENLTNFNKLEETEDIPNVYGDISPFLRAFSLDILEDYKFIGEQMETDQIYVITDEIYNFICRDIEKITDSIIKLSEIYTILEINIKNSTNILNYYNLLKMISRGNSFKGGNAALGRTWKSRTRWIDNKNRVLNSLWFLYLCEEVEINNNLLEILKTGINNILTGIANVDLGNKKYKNLSKIEFNYKTKNELPNFETLNEKYGAVCFWHCHNTIKGYIWMYFNLLDGNMPDINGKTLVFDSYVETENEIELDKYNSLGNMFIRKDQSRKNGFQAENDCFPGVCNSIIYEKFCNAQNKNKFIVKNTEKLKELYGNSNHS